jgi:DNA gyrase subunit A
MNDKNQNHSQKVAKEIEQVNISEEMKQSYIDYSMSVIAGRALPDVRDGLKPVHRRILYAMFKERLTSNKSHRKSSSVVGDVMGDYHPHGDKAIYDALVRMAQDFSMKQTLVDGQGNFGSIDGDEPAAMRYTEARMSLAGELLLKDINKDTVEMTSNYDGRREEPEVLPSKYPNLLVNGSSGIAVGMSCNIPPHNLNEVINATLHYIDNQDCTIEELMQHLKGPDFPTGGVILDDGGIEEAYKTGRGKIRLRASYHIEDREKESSTKIIIDEIPFQSKKARLVEKIAKMVRNNKIEGIKDLRDESNREGIRIVIELKKSAYSEVVENQLLDSVLEKTYSIRNLAIVDGDPKILSLKQIISKYVKHKKNVILRRSKYELEEYKEELSKLEAKLKALGDIDNVVQTIRNSQEKSEAVQKLQDDIDVSEDQAKHVFNMRLGSLTSLNRKEVKNEYQDTKQNIKHLKEIINNNSKLMNIVKDELEDVKSKLGRSRQTEINVGTENVDKKDLIPNQDMIVTLTENNYMKRTHIDEFRTQNRGGLGSTCVRLKDDDSLVQSNKVETHKQVLLFSSSGQVYEVPAYRIPESGRGSLGTPIINFSNIGNENIIKFLPVDEHKDQKDLIMVTKNGKVKRTSMSEYQNIQKTGIKSIKLDNNDELVEAFNSDKDKDQDLVITTSKGKTIRFDLEEVRSVGRTSKGVNGIDLEKDDYVVSASISNSENEEDLLTITENGYGKKTDIEKYRKISRYGKGVKDISTNERNGSVVFSEVLDRNDTKVGLCTEDGKQIIISLDQIPEVSRSTKGVTLMDVRNKKIISCSVFSQ